MVAERKRGHAKVVERISLVLHLFQMEGSQLLAPELGKDMGRGGQGRD
jgi:hypothetical protein